MKNRNNILLGVLLVAFGGIALMVVNDILPFKITMRQVAQFWPLLIILAGIAVILDKDKRFLNATSVLLIALSIPFGVYNCTGNALEKKVTWDFNSEDDGNENFTYEDSSETRLNEQTYTVEKRENIENAKLKISGGGAQFILGEPTPNYLFSADTKLAGVSGFSLIEKFSGNEQDINFKMKESKNFKLEDISSSRKVVMKLNTVPLWDINMEMGAVDLKYDLSPYKIKKIYLETGASNIDIKLGDLLGESNVKIESGVANIKISVPENVGCEIKMEGGLNAKDFLGFTKLNNNLYRTEGFEKASKKIFIETESGMSNYTIVRY